MKMTAYLPKSDPCAAVLSFLPKCIHDVLNQAQGWNLLK